MVIAKHLITALRFTMPVFFLFVLKGCVDKPPYQLPYEINKRVIISKKCDRIIFSSNQYNFFRPVVIDAPFSDANRSIHILSIDTEVDFFAQSLSCDCNTLAMSYEDHNTHGFKTALYDLRSNKITYIDTALGMDFGSPAFSPKDPVLAYLLQSRLVLHNFTTGNSAVEAPPGILFRSLTWSVSGTNIFLEDYDSDIWRYDMYKRELERIWEAPNYFYGSRSITPSMSDEEKFYFLSDYQSDFNQIYRYDPFNKAILVIHSNSDKYLFSHPVENDIVYFKSNDAGFYNVKQYSERETNIVLDSTVVYDFYHVSDSMNVLLLSDINRPASIFLQRQNKLQNLLTVDSIPHSTTPGIFYGPSGIHHLIYTPALKEKGWIVWLHGGPYEQMSVRYNSYLTALLRSGFGIVVLNYPGSTGAGNKYERRELSKNRLLAEQVGSIKHDMDSLTKLIPSLREFSLVGVSYGSIVANSYAKKYSPQVRRLVDFSGLAYNDYTTAIPTLLVYGNKDFSLEDPARTKCIADKLKNRKSKEIVMKNEGHVIYQRINIEKIARAIPEFLDR